MYNRKSIIWMVTALAIIGAATVLFLFRPSPFPDGAPEGTPDRVSLRLQWFPLAQFAGFYTAEAKGFFADERLSVTINPGGPDFNAISLVANGSDTFGVWTADQILAAQSRGVPITIVAAIYRKDPNILMVKADSPIEGPRDFAGKTVTTVYGRATESVLMAMLRKAGVDPKKVNIEPFPFNVQSFVAGKVDVSAGYVYDHVYQARKLGASVRIIDPIDYGINFYSDCLFVRNDVLEKQGPMVERFVHATLRGWEYSLTHKTEAVDIVLTRTSGVDRESQLYMLENSEPLIRHEDPSKIGLVSASSLAAMQVILMEQGVIKNQVNVEGSFTNRYVHSYYESMRASSAQGAP